MKDLHHWIKGGRHSATGDRFAPVFDPATGEQTGRVPLADSLDVPIAIECAREAFPAWAPTPMNTWR